MLNIDQVFYIARIGKSQSRISRIFITKLPRVTGAPGHRLTSMSYTISKLLDMVNVCRDCYHKVDIACTGFPIWAFFWPPSVAFSASAKRIFLPLPGFNIMTSMS
jgi:hypothetical protein